MAVASHGEKRKCVDFNDGFQLYKTMRSYRDDEKMKDNEGKTHHSVLRCVTCEVQKRQRDDWPMHYKEEHENGKTPETADWDEIQQPYILYTDRPFNFVMKKNYFTFGGVASSIKACGKSDTWWLDGQHVSKARKTWKAEMKRAGRGVYVNKAEFDRMKTRDPQIEDR